MCSLSTPFSALILAGLECMLQYEGHLLKTEEGDAVTELANTIRKGLAQGIEEGCLDRSC